MKSELQTRWEAAIETAMENGCEVVEVAGDCCGGCTTLHEYGVDAESPLAWTPGYQGAAYEWLDGVPYYYEDETVEIVHPFLTPEDEEWDEDPEEEEQRVYGGRVSSLGFNHSNGGAEILVAAFKEHGFDVDWDGERMSRIFITL